MKNARRRSNSDYRRYQPSTTSDDDSLGTRGNAARQANSPTPLALVHAKYDASLRGRVVTRNIEQEKAWSQLSHRDGTPVKKEVNSNVCGVAAATAGLEINE